MFDILGYLPSPHTLHHDYVHHIGIRNCADNSRPQFCFCVAPWRKGRAVTSLLKTYLKENSHSFHTHTYTHLCAIVFPVCVLCLLMFQEADSEPQRPVHSLVGQNVGHTRLMSTRSGDKTRIYCEHTFYLFIYFFLDRGRWLWLREKEEGKKEGKQEGAEMLLPLVQLETNIFPVCLLSPNSGFFSFFFYSVHSVRLCGCGI